MRLIRSGKVYEIAAEPLIANPDKDTVSRGGDKVVVEEDRRCFNALGAASQQKQLNGLDAMALLVGVAASSCRSRQAIWCWLRNRRSIRCARSLA